MKISPDFFERGKLNTSADLFFPRYVLLSRFEKILSTKTRESSKSSPKTEFLRLVKGIENLPAGRRAGAVFILTATSEFSYLDYFTKFYKLISDFFLLDVGNSFGSSSVARWGAEGITLGANSW